MYTFNWTGQEIYNRQVICFEGINNQLQRTVDIYKVGPCVHVLHVYMAPCPFLFAI